MLYERWRQVAQARRHELALREQATGCAWTFGELLAASDAAAVPAEGWVCPRGNDAQFILELLRAWRHNRVACPLELTDPAPTLPLPPKNIVHVKRTSATTGAAKHVAFTPDQLAADPQNIISTMGLRPEWPNLGVISLPHSYGFSNLVLPLLLHGIPLILLNSPLPEALRAATKQGQFTLPAVPAMWRTWHETGAISKNIRLSISAGAPLPINLETEIFNQTGVKIHNFLGASECGGIAYDRTETPRTDPTAVGSAMENVCLSAIDGRLEVRSPAVANGYWPEITDGPCNGVFQTSDLVEINEGILHIRGRATDVIHIAGRKVPPEEIECALLKNPAVKECLVFDAPRPNAESQIVAAVVSEKSADELRQHLATQLPAWQIPRQWWFVPAIGANARGKVSRAQWREKFLKSRLE